MSILSTKCTHLKPRQIILKYFNFLIHPNVHVIQTIGLCAMWYQLSFVVNFSSLAIVKFKLVLVIKIQHWVPIVIMHFVTFYSETLLVVPEGEVNANHALITSMFLIAIVLNSS